MDAAKPSALLSQETSRFFEVTSADLPRRMTRFGLARFVSAETNGGSSSTRLRHAETVADIEDAVKRDARTPKPTVFRKRRRGSVTTATVKMGQKKARAKTETNAEGHEETTTTSAVRGVCPPSEWEEMYALVKRMRTPPHGIAAHAAVDTMGCERLADPSSTPRERRFHTLVALMLSSQTKDTVTAAAMSRLLHELPPHAPGAKPGLTLENVLAVDAALLNDLIGKVGFHNTKTGYIKDAAAQLRDRWGSDIPDTIAGLTSLRGMGPKMAYLCMSADDGWGRVEGIGVDVHVHRITNLWGWTGNRPTRTPEETRLALQAWLPRDRWKEINWLLVGLGQTVCLPVGRRCGNCELGLRGLCKAADRKKVLEGTTKTTTTKTAKVRVKFDLDGGDDGPMPRKQILVAKPGGAV